MEELDLTDKDISLTDGEAHHLEENDCDNNTENDEPIEILDIESYEDAPVQEKPNNSLAQPIKIPGYMPPRPTPRR